MISSSRLVQTLLAGSLLLPACRGTSEPAPGVLLVTTEAFRADRTGLEGGAIVLPTLERLAGEGAWVPAVFTPTPMTRPAAASLMTGRPPWEHGVRSDLHPALPSGLPTLAEAFRGAGFRTAAMVGSSALGDTSGLARGFEHYSRVDPELRKVSKAGGGTVTEVRVDPRREMASGGIVLEAGAYLDALPGDEPFLLWVHFVDPAAPHEASAEWRERAGGDPYAAELMAVDEAVARLLDVLRLRGRLETTHVVVAPLTGEGLGEGGETTHGLFLEDRTVRTGLLLRPARGEDLPGLPQPLALQSVAGVIAALEAVPGPWPAAPPSGPVASETLAPWDEFRRRPLRALRDGDRVCVGGAGLPLLASSPAGAGCDDLASALPPLEGRGALPPRSLDAPPPEDLPEILPRLAEAVAAARRLAAAEDDPAGTGGGSESRGPALARELLEIYEGLPGDLPSSPAITWSRADALRRLSRSAEADTLRKELLARNPDDVILQVAAAEGLEALGREPEAETLLRGALAARPGELGITLRLVRLLRRSGRSEEALGLLEHVEGGVRAQAHLEGLAGDLQVEIGDASAALEAYTRAARLAPSDGQWALRRGEQLLRLGRPEEALRVLRAGRDCYPRPVELEARIGLALLALGRREPALEAYRLSLAAPEDTLAGAAELAERLARDGFVEEALRVYRDLDPTALGEGEERARTAARILFEMGKYALALERPAEAERYLARSRQADPASAHTAYLLTLALVQQGREEEAAASLGEALRLGGGRLRRQAQSDPILSALPTDSPVRQILDAPVRKPRPS